ncbi:MAG TPA: hypothetical protein PKW56_07525, partial [Clostridiales bacterium]|nr:hypothetical protein [Clostridiales bacterium]
EKYLKENYNLGLKIEKFDLSILSGITIEKFSFTDNDVPDSLFSMGSFTLKYELWSLLDRKLVVNKIILEQLKINVVRDGSGKFNFDGIIEKFAGKPEEKKPAEEKEKEEKPDEKKESAPQFLIELKNFEVNDIEVSYEDRSSDAPMKAKLPLYSLKVTGVEFRDENSLKADVSFSTGERNLLSFSDKENSVSFRQELDVQVGVVNKDVELDFSHRMKDLDLKSPSAKLSRPGDISVGLKAHYNMESDGLDIKNFVFAFADLVKVGLTGKVTGVTTEQVADITIPELFTDVSGLAAFAEKNGLADLQGAGIKDSECTITDLHVIHSVPKNETKVKGDLAFSAGQASYRQDDISALVSNISLGSAFAVTLQDNALTFSDISAELGLENVSSSVSGVKYSTGRQEIKVRPVLKSDFMPESISYTHKIYDIAEGRIELGLDASFDISDTSLPALIKNTAAKLSVKAEGLRPNSLEKSAPAGLSVSLDEKLDFSKGVAVNDLELKTEFESDTASVFSAADGRLIVSHMKADLNGLPNERYRLNKLTFKMNDVLSAEIEELTADMKKNTAGVGKLLVKADLDGLLDIGKATGNPDIQPVMLYNGSLEMKAGGSGNISDMSANTEIKMDLSIDSLFYEDASVKRGIKISETVNLIGKDVALNGSVSVKGADYAAMLSEMGITGDADVVNNFMYSENGELKIHELGVSVPSAGAELKVKGTADVLDSLYGFDVEVTHSLALLEKYPFVKDIDGIKGKVTGITKLTGNLNSVRAEHNEKLDGIGLKLTLDSLNNTVRIAGLNADIPFTAVIDLRELKLLEGGRFKKFDSFDFLDYSAKRDFYRMNGLPVSNLTIDTVLVNHQLFKNNIRNIALDMYFDDNMFCLNRFYYELFDGNGAGFVRLDLGEGGLDDIVTRANLDMGLTMTGLNTYYLNRKKSKRSPSTEMNVILKMKSKGLDVINEPDLNGEISISKISGDDAKYLLEFLSKNTGDQTAGMVKNMLNAFPGIKVELFSFTIKNNFLYTLIQLKKPWYLVYFPLPEKISLSKQSLKFYIDKYVKEE